MSPDSLAFKSVSYFENESGEAHTQGTEIQSLGLSSEIQRCLMTTTIMEKEISKLTKNEVGLT
jgi:hypothetical protein